MQIVIDIPNSLYANISKIQCGSIASKRILDCVREGTPLPKAENHGFIAVCDSMDAITQEVVDELKNTVFVGNEDCRYCFDIMDIFKADGGDAE